MEKASEDDSAWLIAEETPPYDASSRKEAMKRRTRDFALSIIQHYAILPKSTEAQVIGKQLLRSATSVGAHYREGLRARSDADLLSKLEVALMELEETAYWLELLAEANIGNVTQLPPIRNETEQLICIFITVTRNLKARRNKQLQQA